MNRKAQKEIWFIKIVAVTNPGWASDSFCFE